MPKIRMAEGSTPESGGRRCLRGEMRIRGRVWHPGRSGKQVVTEVRWFVKAWRSTPEIGEREECQRWDVHARQGLAPRKAGEASRPEVSRRPEVKGGTPEIGEREECRGEMPKKRNITSKL